MKRRLDALTRIGRLQALMHDLGRWRLHSLEGQQAGLNDDLKAVFEILDSDEVANGVQTGLVARRIRALQLRLDQLAREQESARRSVLTQGTRAKLGEAAKTVGEPAAQMSANILSAPAAADPENGAVLFAGRKQT